MGAAPAINPLTGERPPALRTSSKKLAQSSSLTSCVTNGCGAGAHAHVGGSLGNPSASRSSEYACSVAGGKDPYGRSLAGGRVNDCKRVDGDRCVWGCNEPSEATEGEGEGESGWERRLHREDVVCVIELEAEHERATFAPISLEYEDEERTDVEEDDGRSGSARDFPLDVDGA